MAPVDWNAPPESAEERERRCHRNAFMMDFENWALRRWASSQGIPTGPERFKVKAWADHMKEAFEDSDTSWDEYVAWVWSGGGDDWFQEDWERETPPPLPLQPVVRA